MIFPNRKTSYLLSPSFDTSVEYTVENGVTKIVVYILPFPTPLPNGEPTNPSSTCVKLLCRRPIPEFPDRISFPLF
jgi:hypothetical protein